MQLTSNLPADEQKLISRRTKRRTRAKWWILAHLHFMFPVSACILTLVSTHIILGPVLNRSGDNIYHLLNEFAIAHNIAVGDSPFGPLGMEFGQPVLRFYQALFYLYNVGVHFLTGMDLKMLHNIPIVVCFAASPFAYMYFLRKLGINRWAAAIGSFLSMASVAAFGNSFEAYHQAGIVTQSMGGLFFPWFMGNFIGMLRSENKVSSTATLFALAFLSHAIMSVFAAFAGVLYFIISPISVKSSWKKLAGFTVLGICLVAFWVFPFIAHTNQMRPIPDSIVRGAGVHWFTSVSKSELAMVLTTGRLLDDPPERKKDNPSPNDKLMDKISIIGTLRVRPPVITALTGLGVLVALFGLKRRSRRFLLAGFAFSVMLFAGPDDYPWLKYLPFIKHIQTFRCTYLVEFFAFGLAGLGVEKFLRYLGMYVRRRRPFLRRPFTAVWVTSAFCFCAFFGSEIILLGQKHMAIRDQANYNAMIDAMSSLDNKAYPFRVSPKHYKGRYKIRHAWLAVHGYQPYCTHWKGTGPSAALHLCRSLGSIHRNADMVALAGVRYLTGDRKQIESTAKTKDKDGDPFFHRLANGRDRRRKPNGWHHLLDTGRDYFLRPLSGEPLPVVCNHAQWIWLAKAWTGKYQKKLSRPNTPIPLRTRAGEFKVSDYLNLAKAVFYIDHSKLAADMPELKKFEENGGVIISPIEIPGLSATVVDPKNKVWGYLPSEKSPKKSSKPKKYARYELGPGFHNTWIKILPDPKRSVQNYSFDIDTLEPKIAILPMEAAPGWKAALDGKAIPTFNAGPDFVGVMVPKGAHRLVFYWEMPHWHRATIWVSLAAVALVILIWILSGVKIVFAFRKERSSPAQISSTV